VEGAFVAGLGYVFSIFSNDILVQLTLLSPFLIPAIGLLILCLRILIRRKAGRRLVGSLLLTTIATYLVFVIMAALLAPTGTSYGSAQPVVVVFGLIYLLLLDFGLITAVFGLKTSGQGRKLAVIYGLAHFATLGLLAYAFYIEPLWLEVTQTEVALAKLPPGTPALKIALISDIHMERWTRRESEVVQKFEQLKPDLIIIAGDHINIDHREARAIEDLSRFFAALHAQDGVYAVAGGVDGYDAPRMLAGSAVRLIEDETVSLTVKGVKLNLVGIHNRDFESDALALSELDQSVPSDGLKFLIYHSPDLASEAARAGYDFYFAGHTHGGQIALPFFGAIFTASKYGRTYAAGQYRLGGPANTNLYVTRGLGMEGMNTPRARLFARPEISVITFKPKD